MEQNSKVATFIGFAIRAKVVKIGLNACATLKRANLMLVCCSTGASTKDKAISLAKKFNCPILGTKDKLLQSFTHKENSKVMAITDKALAKAILDNAKEDFTFNIQESIHGWNN